MGALVAPGRTPASEDLDTFSLAEPILRRAQRVSPQCSSSSDFAHVATTLPPLKTGALIHAHHGNK